jgi:predicted dehydrogenase
VSELRAGIVGPSGIGRAHADALRRLGIDITAVAASSHERSRAIAEELRVPIACASAAELAAHPEVDVVHICTPNALHHDHVLAAIGAGKHVICEKPLAVSSAIAEVLLEAARDAGVRHAVAYNYRYFAMVGALRRAIASDELGRVHLLHGGTLSDELLREGAREHWMFDQALMGIALTLADVGVHWWDIVAYVSGQPVVEAVCARQAVTTGLESAEDSAALMLRLSDGAIAVAALSGAAPGHGNAMTLEAIGTRASAAWRQEDPDCLTVGTVQATSRRRLRTPQDAYLDGFGTAHVAAGHIEGYLDAFRALIGAIYTGFASPLAGEPEYPTFEDGVRGLQVLEALLASASSGQWESVG